MANLLQLFAVVETDVQSQHRSIGSQPPQPDRYAVERRFMLTTTTTTRTSREGDTTNSGRRRDGPTVSAD